MDSVVPQELSPFNSIVLNVTATSSVHHDPKSVLMQGTTKEKPSYVEPEDSRLPWMDSEARHLPVG